MTCYLNSKEDYDLLPEMTFNLEGKEYRIPRNSLYEQQDFDSYWYYPSVTVEVTYIDGWDEWILGLTFLENYYAVYDKENNNIGLALSKMSSMAPQATDDTSMLADATPAANGDDMHQLVGTYATAAMVVGGLYAVTRLLRKKCNGSADDSFRRIE